MGVYIFIEMSSSNSVEFGNLVGLGLDVGQHLLPLQLGELLGRQLEHVAPQVENVVALLVLEVVDLV